MPKRVHSTAFVCKLIKSRFSKGIVPGSFLDGVQNRLSPATPTSSESTELASDTASPPQRSSHGSFRGWCRLFMGRCSSRLSILKHLLVKKSLARRTLGAINVEISDCSGILLRTQQSSTGFTRLKACLIAWCSDRWSRFSDRWSYFLLWSASAPCSACESGNCH